MRDDLQSQSPLGEMQGAGSVLTTDVSSSTESYWNDPKGWSEEICALGRNRGTRTAEELQVQQDRLFPGLRSGSDNGWRL